MAPTAPRLQLRSFAIGSTFVGTSTSVGTRQPKLPCLGLSSRLSFERVWESQGLPRIRPGVASDKTPSTSGRKFTIGRLTSSILNPSSLMLTELQKSPTSFDSFEKDVSIRSEQRGRELDNWDTLVEKAVDSLQPPSILREMGQCCSRGNRLTHTIVAMFQASDPRDKPFEKAQDKLPLLAPTFLTVRKWRDLRQENSEGEKETFSSRAGSERLQPSYRYQHVQCFRWGS